MEPPTGEDTSAGRQLSLLTIDMHFRTHVCGEVSTTKLFEHMDELDKLARRILPKLVTLVLKRAKATAIRENLLTYIKDSLGGAALQAFAEQLEEFLTLLVKCEALEA